MTESGLPTMYQDVLMPGELTDDDFESSRQFLEGISVPEFRQFIKDKTETYNLGDQPFEMFVDRPKDGDDNKAVLFMSEVATGLERERLVAKAIVTRDAVAPEATLVVQPSTTRRALGMNYSADEREMLASGNLRPMTGRLALSMVKIGKPEDITMFCPSLGVIGLDFAGSELTPPVAVTMVGPPNVSDRSSPQLAFDFLRSGSDLSKVVGSNFVNHESSFANLVERDASTYFGIVEFAFTALHKDTLASIEAVRRTSAEEQIAAVLEKGGSVVHSWGDQDNVSPTWANELIASRFEHEPGYISRVLHGLGHTATDFYALDGVLARLAHEKKQSLALFR